MEKIDLSVFLKKFHCQNLPTGGVFLTNPLAAYLKKKNNAASSHAMTILPLRRPTDT